MCGEHLQCTDHTGFVTAQGSACFPALHCLDSRCSERALSRVGPVFRVLPKSEPLRFSGTLQAHRPGWAVPFVPVPGLSSPGGCVLGECTAQRGCTSSSPPRSWPLSFPGSPRELCLRCTVSPMGSWSQAATLLADCQPSRIPGRRGQQLGACSQFGGRCHLWGRDCSSPLPYSSGFTHPPLCLQRGRACTAASLISFGIRSILCSKCTRGHCAALEHFLGQVFLLFDSLAIPQFGLLSCYLILAPSTVLRAFRPGSYLIGKM